MKFPAILQDIWPKVLDMGLSEVFVIRDIPGPLRGQVRNAIKKAIKESEKHDLLEGCTIAYAERMNKERTWDFYLQKVVINKRFIASLEDGGIRVRDVE